VKINDISLSITLISLFLTLGLFFNVKLPPVTHIYALTKQKLEECWFTGCTIIYVV